MAMRAYRFFRTSMHRKSPSELPEEDGHQRTEDKFKEKCQKCGKKLLMYMFSHIGLTGLVVGYSILGGVIFQELESPYEKREKAVVGHIRAEHIQRLWDETSKLNILYKPNWTTVADVIFKDFQHEVFIAVKEKGWDGTEGVSTTDLQWTFAGALLYSVTIITTIGYGNIAPKTSWGRVATIIYAMIGIPLTLLCLANIGGVLGKCFRFLYGRIICGLCRRRRRQQALKIATRTRESGSQAENRKCKTKSCCGKRKRCGGCCGGDNKTEEAEQTNSIKEPVEITVTFEPGSEYDNIHDIIRVPVIVTIGIMAGYIFGGAMLFTLWEKDWDYLVGSYFCFITLSTIGFGDFVPGTSIQSWASQEKRIICTLYLLFGLALLAMCFDLMQEQVRYMCRRFGLWLGIIEDKES